MRLFLAIEFPPSLQQAIDTQAKALQAIWVDPARRWRWVPAGQMHLTLKFLGETPEPSVKRLREVLPKAVDASRRFALSLSGFGTFGRGRDLQVLWMKVKQGEENCRALTEALNAALEQEGFRREPRAFHPHVTLARARPARKKLPRPAPLPADEHEIGPFDIGQVTLYRSVLTPRGPLYEVLDRVPLGIETPD